MASRHQTTRDRSDTKGLFRAGKSGSVRSGDPSHNTYGRRNSSTDGSSASLKSRGSISSSSTISSVLSKRSVTFAEPEKAPFPTSTWESAAQHQLLKDKKKSSFSGSKLEMCDINGYKPLQTPLQVRYCQTLERWMFLSEVKARSKMEEIHTSNSCQQWKGKKCMCGKARLRRLLILDDGTSYVIWKEDRKNAEEEVWWTKTSSGPLVKQDEDEQKASMRRITEIQRNRELMILRREDHFPLLDYLGYFDW